MFVGSAQTSINVNAPMQFSLLEAPPDLLSSMTKELLATIDLGADVYILTYEAALILFEEIKASRLQVVGVDGTDSRADVRGQLIITAKSPNGSVHRFYLGEAHGR